MGAPSDRVGAEEPRRDMAIRSFQDTRLGVEGASGDPWLGRDVQGLAQQFAEEIRAHLRVPLIQLPWLPSQHMVVAVVAAIGLLGVYTSEIWLLLYSGSGSPPKAPAWVVGLQENDPCGCRQGLIMRRIAGYRAVHGELPQDLALLGLGDAAVDPQSGQPYVYERHGASVRLACPNPEAHAPPARPVRW